MQEGDHIGLMRKASGALHFYINGIDQGETLHEETDGLASGVGVSSRQGVGALINTGHID